MSSPFVLANSHIRPAKSKSPMPKKDLHPQPKNTYLDSLSKYPIFSHMKLSHYGFRPKQIKLEQLTSTIEEIYSDRYEVEMQNIRAAVNKILEAEDIRREIRDFNEFTYDFFMRRYGGNGRKAEETLLGVLTTLESSKKDFLHLQLFSDFMNYSYNPDDISCFLLIRSLIERELGIRIVSLDRKTIVDLTKVALTKKQAKKIFEQFMIDEPMLLVEKSFQRFISNNLRTYNSEMIRPYEMMVHGVREYKQLADKKITNSVKNSVASSGSYIDSCLFTTLNQGKKLKSNSTKLTFGVQNMSEKGFVTALEDPAYLNYEKNREKENQWPTVNPNNLSSRATNEFNYSKHNSDAYKAEVGFSLQRPLEHDTFQKPPQNKPLTPYPAENNQSNLQPGPAKPQNKPTPAQPQLPNYNIFAQDTFRNPEPNSLGHHASQAADEGEQSANNSIEDIIEYEETSQRPLYNNQSQQHKQSVESGFSERNYNTVTSLSELCFQMLKRIINM